MRDLLSHPWIYARHQKCVEEKITEIGFQLCAVGVGRGGGRRLSLDPLSGVRRVDLGELTR